MFSTIRSLSVHTKRPAGKVSGIIGRVTSHQASTSSGSGPSINNPASPSNTDKIQHSQEPIQKADVMAHALEDGYSTRSDEEGFGGTFSGNQSLSGEEQEKIVNANPPEYDKTPGSK